MAAARARIAVIYVVAGVFVLLTLVALIVAASVLLAERVGPFAASLLAALFSSLLAIILLVVAMAQRRAAEKREAEEAAAQKQTMLLILAGLPVVKSRTTLLTAVAVGILVGLITAPGKDDPGA